MTAVGLPSVSGSRTTFPFGTGCGGGGGGGAQAPSRIVAAMTAIVANSRRLLPSFIGADRERRAAHAEKHGGRSHRHRVGRLFRDAAGDDRQRSLVQSRVESTLVGRRIERVPIER